MLKVQITEAEFKKLPDAIKEFYGSGYGISGYQLILDDQEMEKVVELHAERKRKRFLEELSISQQPITREEFDKKDATAKMEFVKSGGTVID